MPAAVDVWFQQTENWVVFCCLNFDFFRRRYFCQMISTYCLVKDLTFVCKVSQNKATPQTAVVGSKTGPCSSTRDTFRLLRGTFRLPEAIFDYLRALLD
jgi:hypothetical protein